MAAIIAASLLIGCNKPDPWQVSHIQTKLTPFRSSRLVYNSEDKVNGIDIEFIADSSENHVYLKVHSHPFKPYQGKKKQALVTISDEALVNQFICIRHQGGQKITLTEEARDFMIERLMLGNKVYISCSGYSVDVSSENFESKFASFLSPPKSYIKIQSPLHSLK